MSHVTWPMSHGPCHMIHVELRPLLASPMPISTVPGCDSQPCIPTVAHGPWPMPHRPCVTAQRAALHPRTLGSLPTKAWLANRPPRPRPPSDLTPRPTRTITCCPIVPQDPSPPPIASAFIVSGPIPTTDPSELCRNICLDSRNVSPSMDTSDGTMEKITWAYGWPPQSRIIQSHIPINSKPTHTRNGKGHFGCFSLSHPRVNSHLLADPQESVSDSTSLPHPPQIDPCT